MPRPLTSALAAALAAGAVVAASALGGGEERRPRPAAQLVAPAPPPTRAEAIAAAKDFSERVNDAFARELAIDAERVRAAERAVAVAALRRAVDSRALTAAQRDALLGCFDDPAACDRGALPVGGLVPWAYGPPHAIPRPLPARRRGARPPAVRPLDVMALFARELGVPARRVGAAVGRTHRKLRIGGPPAVDPDGVPPALPPGFAPPAFLPAAAVPPHLPPRYAAPVDPGRPVSPPPPRPRPRTPSSP